MKDAVATMGGLLPDDAGGRDAVHVAVFSAVCEDRVYPGQDVSVVEHGKDTKVALALRFDGAVGIVDPFLRYQALPGERFWVYLYPRTITALSHKWSHPAFEDVDAGTYVPPATKLSSEQWLRDFCENRDIGGYGTVEMIMKAIENGGTYRAGNDNYYGISIDEGYVTLCGFDGYGEIPDEFWDHISNVMGKKIEMRPTYFTCSC